MKRPYPTNFTTIDVTTTVATATATGAQPVIWTMMKQTEQILKPLPDPDPIPPLATRNGGGSTMPGSRLGLAHTTRSLPACGAGIGGEGDRKNISRHVPSPSRGIMVDQVASDSVT